MHDDCFPYQNPYLLLCQLKCMTDHVGFDFPAMCQLFLTKRDIGRFLSTFSYSFSGYACDVAWSIKVNVTDDNDAESCSKLFNVMHCNDQLPSSTKYRQLPLCFTSWTNVYVLQKFHTSVALSLWPALVIVPQSKCGSCVNKHLDKEVQMISHLFTKKNLGQKARISFPRGPATALL